MPRGLPFGLPCALCRLTEHILKNPTPSGWCMAFSEGFFHLAISRNNPNAFFVKYYENSVSKFIKQGSNRYYTIFNGSFSKPKYHGRYSISPYMVTEDNSAFAHTLYDPTYKMVKMSIKLCTDSVKSACNGPPDLPIDLTLTQTLNFIIPPLGSTSDPSTDPNPTQENPNFIIPPLGSTSDPSTDPSPTQKNPSTDPSPTQKNPNFIIPPLASPSDPSTDPSPTQENPTFIIPPLASPSDPSTDPNPTQGNPLQADPKPDHSDHSLNSVTRLPSRFPTWADVEFEEPGDTLDTEMMTEGTIHSRNVHTPVAQVIELANEIVHSRDVHTPTAEVIELPNDIIYSREVHTPVAEVIRRANETIHLENVSEMITQNVNTPVAQVITQITQMSERTDQEPSQHTQMQMNDDGEDQVPSHHTQMQMGDDVQELSQVTSAEMDTVQAIPYGTQVGDTGGEVTHITQNHGSILSYETVTTIPYGTHTEMGDMGEEVTQITQNNGSIPSYKTMTTILPDDMGCIQIQGHYFNLEDHLMTLEDSQRCENIGEPKQAAQADIHAPISPVQDTEADMLQQSVQGLITTNPPSGDTESDMLQQAITISIIEDKLLPEEMPQDQAHFRPIIHSPPYHSESPFDPDVIPLEGEVHQIYSPISPHRPSAPTYDNTRGRSPKVTPYSHPHLNQAHQTIPTTNSQDCSIDPHCDFQSEVSSARTSRSPSPLPRPDTPIPPRVHTPFTSETYTRKWLHDLHTQNHTMDLLPPTDVPSPQPPQETPSPPRPVIGSRKRKLSNPIKNKYTPLGPPQSSPMNLSIKMPNLDELDRAGCINNRPLWDTASHLTLPK